MSNKYYIFLTPEGSTKAPDDSDVENLQVLGFSQGSDEKEALLNLVMENFYIFDSGFEEAIGIELVNGTQFYLLLED